MRRLLWLGVGVAIGVLVVRKLGKVAHTYSPSGLAQAAKQQANSLASHCRSFVADVRVGQEQYEQELIDAVSADQQVPQHNQP